MAVESKQPSNTFFMMVPVLVDRTIRQSGQLRILTTANGQHKSSKGFFARTRTFCHERPRRADSTDRAA
jgi:hypothetical protein